LGGGVEILKKAVSVFKKAGPLGSAFLMSNVRDPMGWMGLPRDLVIGNSVHPHT
jgi:hypothetical protein